MYDANRYYLPKQTQVDNVITRALLRVPHRVRIASSRRVAGLLLLFGKYLIAFGRIVYARRD